MVSSAFVAALSLLSASLARAQTCTPCDDVHFFLARGNNEPYPGRQAALVMATCNGLASCGYENLIYSALYTDLSCQTTYDGSIAGLGQITAYAERCPQSKLILAGYSQGAQIMTDILGGGGGVSFNGCVQPSTPGLDRTTSPGNQISAVLVFGNTRHTGNQPYNFGNGSSYDGLFPRPENMLSALNSWTGIMRDWCLEPDPICAANRSDSLVSTHLGYYDVYSDEAASWIKSVASLTANSDFQTTIPLSISGTAQDYSTIGTATPSGTVTTAATTYPAVVCGNLTTSASETTTSTTRSTSSSLTVASSTGSTSSTADTTSASTSEETAASATETSNSSGARSFVPEIFALSLSSVLLLLW